MNRDNWRSFLIEGVVIIASILIAFGIDAWWDGVRERQDQQELMRAVLTDARGSLAEIQRIAALAEASQTDLQMFYTADDTDLAAVPSEQASAILTGMVVPFTFDPSAGAIAGMIGSGQVDEVEDPTLQAMLLRLAAQFREVDERSRHMADMELHVTRALSRHESFRHLLFGQQSGTATFDMRTLRADETLAAETATMYSQRRVHIRELRALMSLYEEIEQQIAPDMGL